MLEVLELLPEEREAINSLMHFGVFLKVDPNLLDRSNGIVDVGCSDGDQFEDRYLTQCGYQLEQRPDPRIHPITLNGGPLVCAKSFSVNRFPTTADEILGQIYDSTNMKGIVSVVLEGHAPCGVARKFGLTVERQLNLQVEVHAAVRAMGRPNVDVVNHFHVGFNRTEKKTFFVKRQQFAKWLQVYGASILA
jgi:hypothetical protein